MELVGYISSRLMDNSELNLSAGNEICIVYKLEVIGLLGSLIGKISCIGGHVYPLPAPGHIVPLLKLNNMRGIAVVPSIKKDMQCSCWNRIIFAEREIISETGRPGRLRQNKKVIIV